MARPTLAGKPLHQETTGHEAALLHTTKHAVAANAVHCACKPQPINHIHRCSQLRKQERLVTYCSLPAGCWRLWAHQVSTVQLLPLREPRTSAALQRAPCSPAMLYPPNPLTAWKYAAVQPKPCLPTCVSGSMPYTPCRGGQDNPPHQKIDAALSGPTCQGCRCSQQPSYMPCRLREDNSAQLPGGAGAPPRASATQRARLGQWRAQQPCGAQTGLCATGGSLLQPADCQVGFL